MRQDHQSGEIHFVDVDDRDYIQKITDVQASVVILDAVDSEEARCSCHFKFSLARAGWNFFLVEGDGSDGVHNPSFVLDVISASIAALK